MALDSTVGDDREALLAHMHIIEAERARLHARVVELEKNAAKWSSRGEPTYDGDCLATWHKNIGFLRDPRFSTAYLAGMDSGHHIAREPGSKEDIHIEWRVAVACWAAAHAVRLSGDFVECGVNTGIFSLAICKYIDFNRTGKHFFLFDTFNGIPVEQISEGERALGREGDNVHYGDCWEVAQRNFSIYHHAHLIRGAVPSSLSTVHIDRVCYLSIDMNIALPERAALEHFWDKLSPSAPVLLDDYAWEPYPEQKATMDDFARRKGVEILTLPTSQGLLLKS